MSWDNRGNGREAWDGAYEEGGVWDEHKGGPRTRAFGEALLRGLGPFELEYMSRPGTTILDWGCGLGEITALLRGRFPEATVTGLDFSETAIRRATETYGPPFIRADSIEDDYRVIVASNVHEHFVDYLGLIREHLKRCLMYVILTPYEENLGDGESMTVLEREEAGHAHVHRFDEESFPNNLRGFAKMTSELVEPGPLWPGRQLLVVYAR